MTRSSAAWMIRTRMRRLKFKPPTYLHRRNILSGGSINWVPREYVRIALACRRICRDLCSRQMSSKVSCHWNEHVHILDEYVTIFYSTTFSRSTIIPKVIGRYPQTQKIWEHGAKVMHGDKLKMKIYTGICILSLYRIVSPLALSKPI